MGPLSALFRGIAFMGNPHDRPAAPLPDKSILFRHQPSSGFFSALLGAVPRHLPAGMAIGTSRAENEKNAHIPAEKAYIPCQAKVGKVLQKNKSLSPNKTCADCAVRFFGRHGFFADALGDTARKSNKACQKKRRQAVYGSFRDKPYGQKFLFWPFFPYVLLNLF